MALLWELAAVYELDFPRLLALAGHTAGPAAGDRRRMTVALRALSELSPDEQDAGARLHGRAEGAPRRWLTTVHPRSRRADRRRGAAPGRRDRPPAHAARGGPARGGHRRAPRHRRASRGGRDTGAHAPRRALVRAARGLRRPCPTRAAPALHRRPRGDARALPLARGDAARGHGVRAVPRDPGHDRGGGQLRRGRADLPGPGVPRSAWATRRRTSRPRARSPPSTGPRCGRRCTSSPRATPRPWRCSSSGGSRTVTARMRVWRAVASPAYRRRYGAPASRDPARLAAARADRGRARVRGATADARRRGPRRRGPLQPALLPRPAHRARAG